MSTTVTPVYYTPEDLLIMEDGDDYELEDGQLVERNMSMLSSFVAGIIYSLILVYCQKTRAGWPFGEGISFQCFPDKPKRVRKPDAAFIRRDRLTHLQLTTEGHCPISPDLAVEVLSPRDIAYKVDAKIKIWLSAGVQLVWVVNPEQRTLQIHRPSGPGVILHENDEVSGEEVLPGFHCRVAQFFQLEEEPANGK
jgi:Uma2 family endonuclease